MPSKNSKKQSAEGVGKVVSAHTSSETKQQLEATTASSNKSRTNTPMDDTKTKHSNKNNGKSNVAYVKQHHPYHANSTKLVPFLRKLQTLVANLDPNIGSWNEQGTRFQVFDHAKFEEQVKTHFQWTSAQTFNRQLNLYSFSKEESPHWSFGHPCFLRDEPHKIFEIKRFARVGDKESESEKETELGGESSNRVQFLEKQVSALQSIVDDLSLKLARIQVSLNAPPTAPVSTPVLTSKTAGVSNNSGPSPRKNKKRVKEAPGNISTTQNHQQDEEMNSTGDAVMENDEEFWLDEEFPSWQDFEREEEESLAQEFLSSFFSTPQFHSAFTNLGQDSSQSRIASDSYKPNTDVETR
jgi:hypothetical protein